MPTGPAARITDYVAHPLPPVLSPAPGSPNVLTVFLSLPGTAFLLAAVAALKAAQTAREQSRCRLPSWLPACRLGDTIIEGVGPPNTIAKGAMTVLTGG